MSRSDSIQTDSVGLLTWKPEQKTEIASDLGEHMKRYAGDKGKADRLFSQVIRQHGRCESCQRRENLQCAHIISRRFNLTRCDTRNAFCLCARCHMYYTDHPVEFAEFVMGSWAGTHYDALRHKSQSVKTKTDWQERIDFLQSILDGHITITEARQKEC